MSSSRSWIIYFTILIAYLFLIIPLKSTSALLAQLRPELAILVVFYWCLASPERVGLGTAWVVGIFQDALTGSLIGLHALSFVIISFVIIRFYQRIRVSSLLSQTITIFILLLIHKLLFLWPISAAGKSAIGFEYWYSAFTGALIWPLLFILLRKIRTKFGVH